jgi:phage terminase large subunit
MEITLPYNYVPRDYQLPLWNYFQGGGRRAAVVWHRRAGKDLNAVHLINVKAHERVGTYWHLFPTYAQGKKIAWDGKTKAGVPFRAAFPKELVAAVNNTEMKITLKNGSIYQVVGADKPDSLVGANPIGIVYSEWSLMNPSIRDLLRPILAENGGWELFIYTPRGNNHGKKTMERARKDPNWFSQVLTVEDTNAIPLSAIQEDRDDGMSEEMIQQEYYCSFEAPIVGAYYGQLMTKLETEKRITQVPWEARIPVHTVWDLGVGDSTAIWFYQQVNDEIRLIDYYTTSGEGLPHYAKKLSEKPYAYGRHYAPHDIEVRELGTGRSRLETARTLGIKFVVIPKQSIEDGIEAVRNILPRCWFDSEKCENGIEALKQYHKEWDDTNKVFKDTPCHDWSSHGADAFRYLALSLKDSHRKKNNGLPAKAESDYNMLSY